jgi:hypothetical protein
MQDFISIKEFADYGLPTEVQEILIEEMANLAGNEPYDPAKHGRLVILQPEDTDEDSIYEFGIPLDLIPFEICPKEENLLLARVSKPDSPRVDIAILYPCTQSARDEITAQLA